MSEEEKKAIEILKTKIILLESGNNLKTTDEFSRLSEKRDIEIILNLIEKQNKRIEELEQELEPIRELGIPVKTVVAELNRLEDLEDDREQMQLIINELRKENKELQKENIELDKLLSGAGENSDMLENELADSIPKSVIREYKNKFIEDSKNETVFMTHSTQINASLISFCNELLGGSNE